MFVTVSITTVCALSIAFCIRFLVAMVKEHSYTTVCHVVCLDSDEAKRVGESEAETKTVEFPATDNTLARVA